MAQLDQARKLAIAERLRQLRDRDPAIKQPHVADATGVSLRTVQLWEAGDSTPEWEHAEALAKFYAVDVDWMMGRTEAEKRGPTPEGLETGGPHLGRIAERLDLIEDKLDALLAVLATPPAADAATLRAALEQAAKRADEARATRREGPRRKGRGGRAA